MIRTALSMLLFTYAVGSASMVAAETGKTQFGVSLTIVDAAAATLSAPALPQPEGARSVAASGATGFAVNALDLAGNRAFYLATLPGQGFQLQAESLDADAWSSRWREGPGRCVEIVARPVVGGRQTRIQSTALACA